MCGIAGFFGSGSGPAGYEIVAKAMGDAIAHRGPDGSDIWCDAQAGIALTHRRLAIIDLSEAGKQPMTSASGRYVLTYNGEIYNHADLRTALSDAGAAPQWRGHSDTETLLAAIEAWGLERTLEQAAGMFALALWDRSTRQLYLSRDRFGEKPLYYGWSGGSFLFASELKAFRAYPGFANDISNEALSAYFRMLYVPAPLSIYENVYKLDPGCTLTLGLRAAQSAPGAPLRPGQSAEDIHCTRWWSLAQVVERGAQNRFTSAPEAREAIEQSLLRAVARQSQADVPLGAFLSGGIDSSLIVALMQKQSTDPVRTFTIGFEDQSYNEAPFAGQVARHLGTAHTEVTLTAADALGAVPSVGAIYDEPFADSSQLPTHLVCRAARQEVTVALSGDAGDELFGGYNRYFWAPKLWRRLGMLPHPLRRGIGRALTSVSPQEWEKGLGLLGRLGLPGTAISRAGEKAHKLGTRLEHARNLDAFYHALVCEWHDPAQILRRPGRARSLLQDLQDAPLPGGLEAPANRMMYFDALTYLPDDILCKVDRAAMACALETRVPFLDKDVAELAWRLPLSQKIKGGTGKTLLREILYDHVPREMIERPKTGFGIPIGQWLRGALRDWVEDLLDEGHLRAQGLLNVAMVQKIWTEHRQGTYDHTAKLWSILMLQAWLRALR